MELEAAVDGLGAAVVEAGQPITVGADSTVTVDKTPTIGSVVWFSKDSGIGAYGHVAYVEAIEGNTVIVSEDNHGRDFDWSKYNTSDVTGKAKVAKLPSHLRWLSVAGVDHGGARPWAASCTTGTPAEQSYGLVWTCRTRPLFVHSAGVWQPRTGRATRVTAEKSAQNVQ